MTLDQGMNVLEDAEVLSTFVIRMTASFGEDKPMLIVRYRSDCNKC